jgi:formylglycine-generating enzyme required for sulfatase activity
MPRFHALAECVGQALHEYGRDALTGAAPYGEVLFDVGKAALQNLAAEMPNGELRLALRDAVAVPPDEVRPRVGKVIAGLAISEPEEVRRRLADYLALIPGSIRAALRRPSDVDGEDLPDEMPLQKPEDLLFLLPPRSPWYQPGERPPGLSAWELLEPLGLDPATETWRARQHARPELPERQLTLFHDPSLREPFQRHLADFEKVHALASVTGLVPLRGFHADTEPPYLISERLDGYDLAGLMHDWKWRYGQTKPDQAVRLIKRLADVVAVAHKAGLVHRDLKPSNVLLHPTAEERVTLWVRGLGTGDLVAGHALEQARHGPRRGDLHHYSARGAYSPLYASAQQLKREPPDPRDDVYALGVIWYQLLKRDPRAAAPVGHDWPEEFGPAGLTTGQAQLLHNCLATRADRRPRDATALAAHVAELLADRPAAAPKAYATPPAGMPARPDSQEHAAQAETPSEPPAVIKNAIGMTFALIPAGKFLMGSPDAESHRAGQEGPQHEVAITRPFYVGVTPVTQGQWERLKNKNPSAFQSGRGGGPDHPVEQVTWEEAVKFCRKLSELPAERSAGRVYRLPTEAEWEYACRAGTETPFSFGDTLVPRQAHFAGNDPSGWKQKGRNGGKTAPVATHPANAWGLHDLHGNVLEWCQDWFDEYYYFESLPADPPGPKNGFLRVVRGGCWSQFGHECRSAARLGHDPESRSDTIGFRVVLELPQ